MCTISGVIFGKYLSDKDFDEGVDRYLKTLVSGQDNGIDATGLAFLSESDGFEIKGNESASEFVKKVRDDLPGLLKSMHLHSIMGNNRAQPQSKPAFVEKKNRQPTKIGKLVGTHDGISLNNKELAEEHGLTFDTEVDSEVILKLWQHFLGIPLEERIKKVCSEISGGISFAVADRRKPWRAVLMKNVRPLHVAYSRRFDAYIFNSERKNIEAGFGQISLDGDLTCEWIPPSTAVILDMKAEKRLRQIPIINKDARQNLQGSA